MLSLKQADQPLVFDGHNDLLYRLYNKQSHNTHLDFLNGDGEGHVDLPRMKEAGMVGGMFAVYVPSVDDTMSLEERVALMNQPEYDQPLPDELFVEEALPVALEMADIFARIVEAGEGKIVNCTSAQAVKSAMENDQLAMMLHMEGAEALGEDLQNLPQFYDLGLRSIGPVWSRPTRFGHGVPFKYPSTGDTGPGLTDKGKALVKYCNQERILVDLAHMNEAGFWDVVALSDAPLVSTHSNAWAISNHARNLSDRQLDAVRDSDGLVGVVFACAFARPDGRMDEDTSLDTILDQLDYLVERLGIDRVGFGSDFDGAMVPVQLGDARGFIKLREGLVARGFSEVELAKLCHGNWLRVLEMTLGS